MGRGFFPAVPGTSTPKNETAAVYLFPRPKNDLVINNHLKGVQDRDTLLSEWAHQCAQRNWQLHAQYCNHVDATATTKAPDGLLLATGVVAGLDFDFKDDTQSSAHGNFATHAPSESNRLRAQQRKDMFRLGGPVCSARALRVTDLKKMATLIETKLLTAQRQQLAYGQKTDEVLLASILGRNEAMKQQETVQRQQQQQQHQQQQQVGPTGSPAEWRVVAPTGACVCVCVCVCVFVSECDRTAREHPLTSHACLSSKWFALTITLTPPHSART